MNFDIVTSAAFDREAKRLGRRYRSLRNDILGLASALRADPFAGEAIGQGCYKVRLAIASKRRGKSGGARVITLVQVVRERIVLLAIYDKSERATIADRELRTIIDTLT